MVYGVSFGQLLRQARRDRGLDQTALARRAGTTQTYISRLERDDVSPSARTMERLMHALGMELVLGARPLSPGNASRDDLARDYRELTAAQRVEQAMELSEFLTGVAQEAPRGNA